MAGISGESRYNGELLESLYHRFNRREHIDPDPLLCVYWYEDVRDREIAGFLASCLAYGRVRQIMRSASVVLKTMVPGPYEFLKETRVREFSKIYKKFRHRFTTSEELVALVICLKRVIGEYGSIQDCFCSGIRDCDADLLGAMCVFVRNIWRTPVCMRSSLLPDPFRGSACKRLHLFLRWMVRKDNVDPGCWDGIEASKLVIPLDTHMHRICVDLGLSDRATADVRTATEITQRFRMFAAGDPVKYDFSLTRLGMGGKLELRAFIGKWVKQG